MKFELNYCGVNVQVWYKKKKIIPLNKTIIKQAVNIILPDLIKKEYSVSSENYLLQEDDNGILFRFFKDEDAIYIDSIETVDKRYMIEYLKTYELQLAEMN